MKLNYEYTIDVMINKPISLVTKLYVDRDVMHLWEKGLHHIEDHFNQLFESNSMGYLVFSFDQTDMKMKVSVEDNDLPHQITMIYEVQGAWNKCVNHFTDLHGKTKWVMDVIFILETDSHIPKERFIAKTTEAMNIFKSFVEGFEA